MTLPPTRRKVSGFGLKRGVGYVAVADPLQPHGLQGHDSRLSGVEPPFASVPRTSARRPKRSFAQQGKYVRYVILTGRSRISNAKYPLRHSANAYSQPVAVTGPGKLQVSQTPSPDSATMNINIKHAFKLLENVTRPHGHPHLHQPFRNAAHPRPASVPPALNRIVFLKSLPIVGFGVDKPYSPPIIKRMCIF